MKNIFLNSNNLTIGYGNEIVIQNLSLSLNDEKNYEKKVQTITDEHIKIVDEKVSSKEKEIMTI